MCQGSIIEGEDKLLDKMRELLMKPKHAAGEEEQSSIK